MNVNQNILLRSKHFYLQKVPQMAIIIFYSKIVEEMKLECGQPVNGSWTLAAERA